jgi:hypothetical protein
MEELAAEPVAYLVAAQLAEGLVPVGSQVEAQHSNSRCQQLAMAGQAIMEAKAALAPCASPT